MKRWEYNFILVDKSEEPIEELNHYGRDGWEVCAYEPNNKDNYGVFYLRREISEAQALGRGACDEIELEINRLRKATRDLEIEKIEELARKTDEATKDPKHGAAAFKRERERARCAVELEADALQLEADAKPSTGDLPAKKMRKMSALELMRARIIERDVRLDMMGAAWGKTKQERDELHAECVRLRAQLQELRPLNMEDKPFPSKESMFACLDALANKSP